MSLTRSVCALLWIAAVLCLAVAAPGCGGGGGGDTPSDDGGTDDGGTDDGGTLPGQLDVTFGADGVLEIDFGLTGRRDVATDAIELLDERILAVGGSEVSETESHVALARINPEGTLDRNFHSDGRVTYQVNMYDTAVGVVRLPDDEDVVVGVNSKASRAGAGTDFYAIRINPDGTLDTTGAWGPDGIISWDIGTNSEDLLHAVSIQDDGKILLAGQSDTHAACIRINPEGTLDGTFGNGGIFLDVSAHVESIKSVDVQPDGKIVLAGVRAGGASGEGMLCIRLTASGDFDNTFDGDGNHNGKCVIDFGGDASNDGANSVSVEQDGKIRLTGYTDPPAAKRMFAGVRLLPDGRPDPTFNNNGRVARDISPETDAEAQYSVRLPSGQYLVTGRAVAGTSEFAWLLSNSSGTDGIEFGMDGRLTESIGDSAEACDFIVQKSGKFVTIGTATIGTRTCFAITRHEGPGVAPLVLSTFQAAAYAMGQNDRFSGDENQGGAVGASTMREPSDVAIFGSNVFVADSGNNRILQYFVIPVEDGPSADLVHGQPGFGQATPGTDRDVLRRPSGVGTDGQRLFCADRNNNRVLEWENIPSMSGADADQVFGQPGFSDSDAGSSRTELDRPLRARVIGGKLFVVDANNDRVLVWNDVEDFPGSPDIVLGDGGGVSASSLNRPGDVWTDGTRVAVVDTDNNRVLIWNSFPTTDGAAADVVVGQESFSTSGTAAGPSRLNTPAGVFFAENQLIIADSGNHRVLVYNQIPMANSAAADVVLGQSNFTNNASGGPTPQTMNEPVSVLRSGNRLFVADRLNHRVLVFEGQ